MELKDRIKSICDFHNVKLNNKNKEFLSYIDTPLVFEHSTPGEIGEASENNKGETSGQREIFKNQDTVIWLDMELPIGKSPNTNSRYKRIDLIGKYKDIDKYILCELKHTKKAGQPFDALLQLIAYYVALQSNWEKLDPNNHHKESENFKPKMFKWKDVAKNVELRVRANKEFWLNWNKPTPKNKATKEIIEFLKNNKLIVRLFSDDNPIFPSKEDAL